MKAYICVDDTDSLDKAISTGKIADYIKKAIETNGLGVCEDITRHQLLLHPDIPYTSHNSSMCMVADLQKDDQTEAVEKGAEISDRAAGIILQYMADGSDPGFCLCLPDRLTADEREKLIQFGQLAQQEVVTKAAAYELAKALNVHLSEHGGTGQGVVGALAGVGLRLSGNDGRYKGKLKVKPTRADGLVTVKEICLQTDAEEVRDMQDKVLADNQLIELGSYAKAVLVDHKKVILVAEKEDGGYITCTKEQLEGGE